MLVASIFISEWWKTENFWSMLIGISLLIGLFLGCRINISNITELYDGKIKWNPWWFSLIGIVLYFAMNIVLFKTGNIEIIEDIKMSIIPFVDLVDFLQLKSDIPQMIIRIVLIGIVSSLLDVDEDKNNKYFACIGNVAWGIIISSLLSWVIAKPIAYITDYYYLMNWHLGKILLTIIFIVFTIIFINSMIIQFAIVGICCISETIIDYDYIYSHGGDKVLNYIDTTGNTLSSTIIITIITITFLGIIRIISYKLLSE